ncbi:benzoylformate decarboxylase [Myroides sp. LJL115]
MKTVKDKTFELLRNLGIDTIFGNPGSTEETFLENFPSDFTYVQVLQEASAVAAADAYAQATKTVGFVNVHTAAGLSNAMSGILSASMNKTPLIITAGNQTREMLLLEPWLTNVSPEELPRPFVKWSYEPKSAEDVPDTLMRAYAMALQEPAGPVFVSIPLDDWGKPCTKEVPVRSVSSKVGPDPERLAIFADKLSKAKNPVLIFGADIVKFDGWKKAVAFAELMQVPVFSTPGSEKIGFPQDHDLYAGGLPFAIAPLSDMLKGYDVALVVGAPVFRYYPYVPGDYIPQGLELLHITNDPNEAGRAPVGDSLISNPCIALEYLSKLVKVEPNKPKLKVNQKPSFTALDLDKQENITALEVFRSIREIAPKDAILVQESPSSVADLLKAWPITIEDGLYTMASGSLGWGLPAAVGVGLAQKKLNSSRPVVAMIGDGAFQYSIQGLWTAKQHNLPIVYIVPINGEYGILKAFADCQNTPNVPGLDLPGLDFCALAKGYGLQGKKAKNLKELQEFYEEALKAGTPTVLSIEITREVPPLY